MTIGGHTSRSSSLRASTMCEVCPPIVINRARDPCLGSGAAPFVSWASTDSHHLRILRRFGRKGRIRARVPGIPNSVRRTLRIESNPLDLGAQGGTAPLPRRSGWDGRPLGDTPPGEPRGMAARRASEGERPEPKLRRARWRSERAELPATRNRRPGGEEPWD